MDFKGDRISQGKRQGSGQGDSSTEIKVMHLQEAEQHSKFIKASKRCRKALLVSTISLFFTVSMAWSQTFTNGDWIYTLNASSEATITGSVGLGGSVTIPSSLNGATVRRVTGSYNTSIFGFRNTSVRSVAIASSVTNIGPESFMYCEGLTNVSIPNGVRSIDAHAFNGCVGLTNILIPGSVTNVDNGAFYYCAQLRNLTLCSGVERIGYLTFGGCSNLTTVTIPASVTNFSINPFGGTGVSKALFLGNAPAGLGVGTFPNTATIYRLEGSTGFPAYLGANAVLVTSLYTQADLTNGVYTQAQYDANRTNGRADVTNNPAAYGLFAQIQYDLNRTNGRNDVIALPNAYNLFSRTQYDANRISGRADVTSDPATYGLYTSDSIMDLRMGGLIVQKSTSNAVVVFQPQTTTDLALPFTNNGTPITNELSMPGDKGFIRIRANQ